MNDTMTSEERVSAAINLQPTDRVPCAVDLSYFVARHKGVTMAEFLTNLPLQMELQHQVFEELDGIDYVLEFPSATIFNRVAAFKFMPMKVKLPGIELPADSIPQYHETEVVSLEGYDIILEKGWVRYAEEHLLPGNFTELKEIDLKYDEEADQRFYQQKRVFFPQLGPPALLPFELFSFGRSLGKISLDLYRCPEKLIAAMDAIFPDLLKAAIDGIKVPGAPVLMPISRGSNGFLSPKQFEKFLLPYLLKIAEAIVSRGSPIFFHLDQAWGRFLPYFKRLPEGRYLLHFDGMTDLLEAKRILGDRMCIMGDVPARLLKLGTPESVKAYCRQLIATIGRGGGFILSPG